MTPDEAAQRTGLAPRDITRVAEHPLGHVVTTRDSGPLLVTPTVVRRYVPDVDDEPVRATEPDDEVDDEPVRATEPDDSAAAAAPAPRGRARKAAD